MTAPTSTVLAQHDLALGGERTLRLSLVRDEYGTSLVLASGFGGGASGREFRRPGWSEPPLALPADALPELRAALEHLSGDAGGRCQPSGPPAAETAPRRHGVETELEGEGVGS